MVNRSIPSLLPECDLIQILADKAAQRNDVKFDFIGKLNDFRDRVSAEVRQINLLFPEYTPHDEDYHLSKLFHVASLVLGRDRLEGMNSTELFILAVSLYGHDWGMAVSESEKETILGNKKLTSDEEFWILPDEEQRFFRFLKKQGFQSKNDCMRNVSIELWREYVRQTHADRSGERVRKYFENIDGGIADAASRVCIGHWLEFEDLEDYHLYPQDFSVLRESVNLRALAIYLRLIDLLDLSEDRTPYVIWKFVAPRDLNAKMEWAKHRALHPITCPSYQQGRIIQVDGSTDDHEVYAALEDLRIWCEEQLRGCNDILARMNDAHHRLDIYHIDWRVAPRGFKPVLIRFEFDRERMFEILGDDIYQSDPYVFLRELLQNSIDAIRMRREVLKRKGIESRNVGAIRVHVEHVENGDAVITWIDDGIGMDDYILRNYFAVAGKSYYRSADFEREGLNIDPISRFGIGFLSCFMVSDRVVIDTYREPYLPPPSEPLRITIPAVKRQFRVELMSRDSAEVGTKIQIYVEGRKLPKDNTTNQPQHLDVTTYLSDIAGFVEFPIVIDEMDRRTIILHPKQDPQPVLERFGKEYQIQKITLEYPWKDVVLPQDLHLAQENFTSVNYDLSADLCMAGYEGNLIYLVPKNKLDIFETDNMRDSIILNGKTIRWEGDWSSETTNEQYHLSRGSISAIHSNSYCVYRDGILISQAESPVYREGGVGLTPPKLIVNLPKTSSGQLNLARTEILEKKDEKWYEPILQSHLTHIINKSLPNLITKNDLDRLYDLGYITFFHHNDPESLWKIFPHDSMPVLFLEKGGIISTDKWDNITGKSIYSLLNLPRYLYNEINLLLNSVLVKKIEYKGWLGEWVGDSSTFEVSGKFMVINSMSRLYLYTIRQDHRLENIRFLRPISNKFPPIVQSIYTPAKIPSNILDLEKDDVPYMFQYDLNSINSDQLDLMSSILKNAYQDPSKLTPIEIDIINQAIRYKVNLDFVRFESPYDSFFSFGLSKMNLKNPIGSAIYQLHAWVFLARIQKLVSLDKIGCLYDKLNRLFAGDYSTVFMTLKEYPMFCKKMEDLWLLVKELKIAEIDLDSIMKNAIPSIEEFIPNTVIDPHKFPRNMYFGLKKIKNIQPFGDVLETVA